MMVQWPNLLSSVPSQYALGFAQNTFKERKRFTKKQAAGLLCLAKVGARKNDTLTQGRNIHTEHSDIAQNLSP